MKPAFQVLPTLDKFRLRLGWVRYLLSKAAAADGPAAIESSHLADATELQNDWLADAGIKKAPLGKYSKRATKPILRMGVDLKVWGAAEPRRLTDLGEVARIVAGEWDVTPFSWSPSTRFIGLRLVLGADGDVLLPLFRAWPDNGTAQELRGSIGAILSDLAARAPTDEERNALNQQSERVLDDSTGKTLWPRLEPLRELGYVTAGKSSGSYLLSEVGTRARAWLGSNKDLDASDILERALPQLHAASEDVQLGEEARPEDLRDTLLALPPALTSGGTAAAIEPVALLVHSRYLKTGKGGWSSPDQLRSLVRKLSNQSGGLIAPQNAGSELAANVAWQTPSVLTDEELWQSPLAPSHGTDESLGADERAVEKQEDTRSSAAELTQNPDRDEEHVVSDLTDASKAGRGSEHAETPEKAADEVGTPERQDAPGVPSTPQNASGGGSDGEAATGATPGGQPPTPNLRAWWAHTLRLVRSDRLAGDSVLHGGPETLLTQFRLALTAGTARSLERQRRDPPFSGGLDLWLKPLEAAIDVGTVRPEAEAARPLVGLMRRFKIDWDEPEEVPAGAARATLDLLVGDRERRQMALRRWLLAVLADPSPVSKEEWKAVQTISRGFIDDALHVMRTGEGILRSPEAGLSGAESVIDLMLKPAEEMPASLEVSVLLGEPADRDVVYERVGEIDPGKVGAGAVRVLDVVRPLRVETDAELPVDAAAATEMDVVVSMSVQAEGEDEAQAIAARCATGFMLELRGLLPVAVAARTSIRKATARAEPAAPATELGPSWDQYALPSDSQFRIVSAPGPERIGALFQEPRDRARVNLLMERLLAVRNHEPFEGISSLWDAAEQCAQGAKGEYFPRLLSAVSLVRTRQSIRQTHLELLWGLVIAGREGESSGDYYDLVEAWFGQRSRSLVEQSDRGAFLPFPDLPRIGDTHSCEALFRNWQHLEPTAKVLEHHCPFVSRLIRRWMSDFGSGSAFSKWSDQSREETGAFIRQVYDVRNRTRHQGDANHACQPQAERFSLLCRLILDELVWEAAGAPGALGDVWDRVVQRDRILRKYARGLGRSYLRAASLLEHRLVPKAKVEAERVLT